jgi:hypothetical protein
MGNKLFDIIAGKVVIHTDMLGIPAFKVLWNKYDDKDYANSIISYIVLKHHYSSPYVESIGDMEYRDGKLRSELFEEGWEPTDDILYAESTFLEFSNTLLVQLLEACRHSVYVISSYLKEMMTSNMDMKTVKEAMQAMASLDKTVKSLDSLAKQVKREDMESTSVRGGSEIGHFEIPKAR